MKYTLEQLRAENQGYAYGAAGITVDDLAKVNAIIERIEQTRTEQPQKLDGVRYTDKYGMYHSDAIIDGDTYHTGGCALCESGLAYVFIDEQNMPGGSISGGSFPQIDKSKLRYIGKHTKRFWTFSTLGVGANQGLYFSADVSFFELNERPEHLRHLTTEKFDRITVNDHGNSDYTRYHYTVDIRRGCDSFSYPLCGLKNSDELRDFLARYEAQEEPGADGVYWILKRETVWAWTKEEFDAIENAEITRETFNGRDVLHKYVKKDSKIFCYVLRSDEQRYTA